MLIELVSKLTIDKFNFNNILKNNGKTILYFYSKDNTPGCSTEALDFNNLKNELTNLGYQIIGVSKDTIESHKIFIENKDLNFPLISDTNLDLHKKFGAFGEKNNYGKIVLGVIRSTFLLDGTTVIKERRNIKAKGHAKKVYDYIKNL